MSNIEYIPAHEDMADDIRDVLHSSIRTVYPKYYPVAVVEFFCTLHSKEHVLENIRSRNMEALVASGRIVGVGCADGNHITSVYVRPECQGRGYGTRIMDCLERRIAQVHDTAVLDASLPATLMYEHRGYKTTRHEVMEVEDDVRLVYAIMEKQL